MAKPGESLIHEIESPPQLNLQPLSMAEILTSYARSLGPQKGLLFEDPYLQIGFTTECKGNKVMIKLFMGNKTQSDLTLDTFQIG